MLERNSRTGMVDSLKKNLDKIKKFVARYSDPILESSKSG